MSSPEASGARLFLYVSRVTLACAQCSHLWRRDVSHHHWPLQDADIEPECPNCGAPGEAQVFEEIASPSAP